MSNADAVNVLGYTFGNQLAQGTLFNGNFQLQTLAPLPGLDSARPIGPLMDGTALGFSYNTANIGAAKLTRWTNGIPSEITVQDPANPSATFAYSFSYVNSKGDLTGAYLLNGQTSLYRYNIYNSALEIIPIPDPSVANIFVLGANDAGHVVSFGLEAGAVFSFYDPIAGTWQAIKDYPGTRSGIFPHLAENGAIAFSASYDSNDSGVPLAYINGSYVSLLNPPPSSGFGPRVSRNVFGYNSAGLAVGNTDTATGFWMGGVFVDIGGLIVNPQGWSNFIFANGASIVTDIDERGRIYGVGVYNGQDASFVLTPVAEVPEPATAAFLAIGLIALTARRFLH